MFVEQRLYTCAPGQTGEFLRVYEREGRVPQMQHLGQPVGYYISEIGTLNQVTTLWAYGSLDERVERRRALFQNADWNAFLAKARLTALSSSAFMARELGPMNRMLQFSQTSAKCAFSERKP